MDNDRIKIKLELVKVRIDFYHKVLLLVIAVIGGLWVWGFSNHGVLANLSLIICLILSFCYSNFCDKIVSFE